MALALPLLMVGACRPDQPTDPGTAYGAGDGVPGTWRQSGATIYDITVPVPEALDVSSYYQKEGNGWVITFSEDGSYVVDQRGKGPNAFGLSGTWSFDTASYPTDIFITPTGESTIEMDMLNAPRSTDSHFGLRFDGEKCGTPNIRYDFIFTRNQ